MNVLKVVFLALFACLLPSLCAQDPDANLQPSAEPAFVHGGASFEISGDTFTIELDVCNDGSVTIILSRDSDRHWREIASASGLPFHVDLTYFRLWLGSEGDDWLGDMTSTIPIVCFGFGGDDVLLGGSANDCLVGGAGNDRCLAGAGNDRFWGGLGCDGCFGGAGDDEIAGGPDNDDAGLHGAGFIPTVQLDQAGATEGVYGLCGGTGNDCIWGDSQADIAIYGLWLGGGGKDAISADASATESAESFDRLYGAECVDNIYGCPGTDRIWGGNEHGDGDFIDAAGGDDLVWSEGGQDAAWGGQGFDQIWGGENNDSLHAAQRFNDIDSDFNIIDGESGDDKIYGASRGDALWGAGGHDTILGNDGADRILGEDGDDTLSGDDGDDRISGGSGDDACYGEAGSDAIWGGSGMDTLCGGADDDYIFGGADGDVLKGDVQAVDLTGSGSPATSGNDKLVDISSDSHDILLGNAGSDTLIAFDKNTPMPDWLYGGDGLDVFYYDEESLPIGHPDEHDHDYNFDGGLHLSQPANLGDPAGRTEPARF